MVRYVTLGVVSIHQSAISWLWPTSMLGTSQFLHLSLGEKNRMNFKSN